VQTRNNQNSSDKCQKFEKKFNSEVMTSFFGKLLAKCTNVAVSSPGRGLKLQVSRFGLGVFDEASVSSRNFNQVFVSVSKVTVSTASLP